MHTLRYVDYNLEVFYANQYPMDNSTQSPQRRYNSLLDVLKFVHDGNKINDSSSFFKAIYVGERLF